MLKAVNRLVTRAGVVAGAPLGHARRHRQHRLGQVRGLHLRLLIQAQHHGALGRGVVQADDLTTFSTKSGSVPATGAKRADRAWSQGVIATCAARK